MTETTNTKKTNTRNGTVTDNFSCILLRTNPPTLLAFCGLYYPLLVDVSPSLQPSIEKSTPFPSVEGLGSCS